MPLAEVLVKIHRYRAPGRVDCKRGDEIKRIYLDHGQIVFATTNQLAESLGDKLLREGRITRRQYEESVARARETGSRHGTTLVEMKALSAEELFTAVRGQIEEIIWPIFGWDSGIVSFTAGRDKRLEFIKVDIPVPMAILHGVRRVAEARALVARLGTKTTLFGRSAGHTEGLVLDAEEQGLLDAVDGRKVLYELVNTPPLPSADNARILYAFFALGLIVPREPRQIKVQLKTDGGKYA
ncbi:MAG: hypothetical protein QOF63_794 [Thermoanaerobaculia bacterium]|jgi:hypothetical protein|nr:hypothetical protein [Thermoanaerobaculia bacterium]